MSLDQLAQQQRMQILARERALASQIDSAYSGLWRSLARKLLKLFDAMQKAEQAAKAGGYSFDALLWWHQIRRLDTLLLAAQQDLETFIRETRTLIQTHLQPISREGAQHALKLLKEALPEGIGASFGRPSLRAFDVLAARDYQFKKLEADAILAVRRRLLAGLALGQGPSEVAYSIQQGLSLARSRALTIARTELLTSYRDAALDTYRANADVVREWEWSTAEDERVCPLCGPLDKKRFPLAQPFLAQHPNDRCTPVPVTYSYDEILARLTA